MAHLVDTDILIDAVKGEGEAVEFLDSLQSWSISVVTAMELIVGARNQREGAKIDKFLGDLAIVPLATEIGELAYELLKAHSRTHGLRVFDAIIAATAVLVGASLATRNQKHFKMVRGLEVEVPEY